MNEIEEFELDDNLLPDELLADDSNPMNDEYYVNQRTAQRSMLAHQATMKGTHVEVAKLVHLGKTHQQIADATGYKKTTVGHVLKRRDVQQLLQHIRHYQAYLDGPTAELRLNALWRIFRRNEHGDPRTAINAIQEMNKMTGQYKDAEQEKDIQIHIHNGINTESPLDG